MTQTNVLSKGKSRKMIKIVCDKSSINDSTIRSVYKMYEEDSFITDFYVVFFF